ncbi:RNA recognition motif domain-containing protein [Thermodesulfobacteriota bacterium]
MNIYLGNLSYEVTEEDLMQAFEAFGDVESVKIIKDKYTDRSKGFGLVEMPNNGDAQSEIDSLNDTELKG